MSWSDNRREYLDQKYAPYNDEDDSPRVKKRKRAKPKKADHKHDYQNCVLREEVEFPTLKEPSGTSRRTEYYLGSVCSICGKVGPFDHKKDVYHEWWEECHVPRYWRLPSFGAEYDAMIDKYRSVLKTYDVPAGFGTKYVSVNGGFLIPPKEKVEVES